MSEAHRALFELAQRRRTHRRRSSPRSPRRSARRAPAWREQEALAAKLLRLQYQQGAPDRLRLAARGTAMRPRSRATSPTTATSSARAPSSSASCAASEDALAALAREARGAARRAQAERARAGRRGAQAREASAPRARRCVARLAGDIAQEPPRDRAAEADEARLDAPGRGDRASARRQARAEGTSARGAAVERVADASLASKPFESLKGLLELPGDGRAYESLRRAARGNGRHLEGPLHPRCFR